jgi:hypothetical protein
MLTQSGNRPLGGGHGWRGGKQQKLQTVIIESLWQRPGQPSLSGSIKVGPNTGLAQVQRGGNLPLAQPWAKLQS